MTFAVYLGVGISTVSLPGEYILDGAVLGEGTDLATFQELITWQCRTRALASGLTEPSLVGENSKAKFILVAEGRGRTLSYTPC
jgi:hypothetical protein